MNYNYFLSKEEISILSLSVFVSGELLKLNNQFLDTLP